MYVHVEFIEGPAHKKKRNAEDILTHDVPLAELLGLIILILLSYHTCNYPMGMMGEALWRGVCPARLSCRSGLRCFLARTWWAYFGSQTRPIIRLKPGNIERGLHVSADSDRNYKQRKKKSLRESGLMRREVSFSHSCLPLSCQYRLIGFLGMEKVTWIPTIWQWVKYLFIISLPDIIIQISWI